MLLVLLYYFSIEIDSIVPSIHVCINTLLKELNGKKSDPESIALESN